MLTVFYFRKSEECTPRCHCHALHITSNTRHLPLFCFPSCITMSSSLWAWFSLGTIRYNLSLATQFHISSQTLISKLLFDLGRVVDQGPCGCRCRKFIIYFVNSLCHVSIFGFFYTSWVSFSFLFNCQVGMLRVHFTDPKLYVLLILFYFSTSSHQPLPRVSLNSCCTGCVSESGDFATLFLLVRHHWGGCCYHHFAANFKAF